VLDYTHDWRLVAASVALALMAGFTGLSTVRGASALASGPRKAMVSMAAVALGGGIWSMHFVAMLGVQLPVPYFYDALVTLISALVAILAAGAALLILHFRPRSPVNLTLAGAVIGGGIMLMHYIGMSAMELCLPVYSVPGVVAAVAVSVGLSVAAVRLAYRAREMRNIVLGTLGFAGAVVVAHYVAMAGTGFAAGPGAAGPAAASLGNPALALLVTLAAFAISAGFLLTGATLAPAAARPAEPPAPPEPPPPSSASPPMPRPEPVSVRIPHERDGATLFVEAAAIAAVRAEGHYTILHRGAERLFCPWSLTEAEARLVPAGFLRVHRSYLANPAHIARFERRKDTGACTLAGDPGHSIPVSRSHLASLREALGV
jgi:NO-binding membrane sensor protein with MHYT domain